MGNVGRGGAPRWLLGRGTGSTAPAVDLASLVPPPRAHLTGFHGVFAPGAKLKPRLAAALRAEPGQEASGAPAAAPEPAGVEPPRHGRPRLDWAGLLRRSFALDIFSCARCGGQAPGVGLPHGPSRGALDMGAPGPALAAAEAGPGPGATPERLVLNSQPLEPSSPRTLPPPPAGARLGTGVPQAAAGPGHEPGQRLGWHPAAALLPRWARGPTPQKGLYSPFI
jgi:hypothetical protein